MGLTLGFFKVPKHRVFNYQPLYYDEQKEALQEKLQKHNKTEGESSKNYKPGSSIRGNMSKVTYENRKQKGSSVNKVIVLISVLGMLTVAYFVAKSLGYFFV